MGISDGACESSETSATDSTRDSNVASSVEAHSINNNRGGDAVDDDQTVSAWDSDRDSDVGAGEEDDISINSDAEDDESGGGLGDMDFFDDVLEELGLQDALRVVDDPLL